MALRGKRKHYDMRTIRRDHFNATAYACGLGADMNEIIDATVEAIPWAIDRVAGELPKNFPVRVFETITAGLTRMSRVLRRG